MKRALVLCGGGSRGAYEVGVYHALQEAGYTFDIVVGTSIGAINGMLIAQGMDQEMDEIWDTITIDQVMVDGIVLEKNIGVMMEQRSQLLKFIQQYPQRKGVDTSPLHDMIHAYANPQRIKERGITFGCVTVEYPSLSPITITLDQMKDDEEFVNYIIASSSCWPLFPVHSFQQKQYIDGGYYDNLPIQFAWELGADEIVAVCLRSQKPIHTEYTNHPFVTYIQPTVDTGSIMQFDHEHTQLLIKKGYLEAKRTLGIYKGVQYTFDRVSNSTVEHIIRCYYQHIHHLDSLLTHSEKGILPHPQTKCIDIVNHLVPYQNNKETWTIQLVEICAKAFGFSQDEVYDLDDMIERLIQDYQTTLPTIKNTLEELNVETLGKMKDIIANLDQKIVICMMCHYLSSSPNLSNSFQLVITMFPNRFLCAVLLYALTNEKPLFQHTQTNME